jgi:hypothetical protein
MIIAFIILLCGNLTFIFGGYCPPNTEEYCYIQLMPMILLGIGDSILALALLTGFPYVVSEWYFGLAFGVTVAF